MSKPDYLISTPENVDLHLELAGLGNRILAALIDALVAAALMVICVLVSWLAIGIIQILPEPQNIKSVVEYFVAGLMLLLLLSILLGYFIFFEGIWQGQTPGKKVAGIRVIEHCGQPVSWPAVIIRNMIRVIDLGFMLIGLLPMLIDPHERRLGDFAAGTLVIRERHPSESSRIIAVTAPPPPPGLFDIGRIKPEEYDLIVSFLSRREQMRNNPRSKLAAELDLYFRERLNAQNQPAEPETFLEQIYSAYRARAGEFPG